MLDFANVIQLGADGQAITPSIVLAYKSGRKQGVITHVSNYQAAFHMNSADEISFDVTRTINDEDCKLWKSIKNFKLVYIPEYKTNTNDPWYEITVTLDEDNKKVKHINGVHAQEAELSQLRLYDTEINTEDDIARDDYQITKFYDPNNPEGSLLNRILKDKAPHYKIHHVDSSLMPQQRTFSFNGTTIYDALTQDIAKEFNCLFIFGISTEDDGKIHRTVSAYDLYDYCEDCGERGEFGKTCPKCGSTNIQRGYGEDTQVYISRENLSNDITYDGNADNVKNCFHLTAGDDLMTSAVRMCNPNGSAYIWYLSDETRAEMSEALRNKLAEYDKDIAKYNATSTDDGGVALNISADDIAAYNALVKKYQVYDTSIPTLPSPIVGFPTLSECYYDVLDMRNYLQKSLMPKAAARPATTAKKELAALTDAFKGMGVQHLAYFSKSSADSAIQTYARVYYDSAAYKLKISNSTYSNATWNGTITLTSYTDEADTASGAITATFVENYEEYVKDMLDKTMAQHKSDNYGIVALMKQSLDKFKESLKNYCVDSLKIILSVDQSVLDVLIQNGLGDDDQNDTLYTQLYEPYYNKLTAIQQEIQVRDDEIATLQNEDKTGLLDKIVAEHDRVNDMLNIKTYLGDELWTELSSFRREDEYSNSNYISDGLDNAGIVKKAQEFVKAAQTELIKSAISQQTISASLKNLLLLGDDGAQNQTEFDTLSALMSNYQDYVRSFNAPFAAIMQHLALGNWIHFGVDDEVYKLRMSDFSIDYGNIDEIKVTFTDAVLNVANGIISDVKSVLDRAQSMATSYGSTQRQAKQGDASMTLIQNMVANGLDMTNKRIVSSADNQDIVVDEHGMLMRRENDYSDGYSDEQAKLINSGLYYTDDNWAHVKTAVGHFQYYDPEDGKYKDGYGALAQQLVGNLILGNNVGIYNLGGSFKITDDGVKFVTNASKNADGTQKITSFTIARKDSANNEIKQLYIDSDGNVKIAGSSISISDEELPEYLNKKSVSSVDVQYGNSDNSTTAPTEWTANANWKQGKYLWTRTKTVYGDSSVQYSDPSLIAGESGLGVASVVEQYYLSTSNTTAPSDSDTGWADTQQTWVTGRYYWTRSKITWADGTITYTSPTLAVALTSGNQSTDTLDSNLGWEGVFNRLTNGGAIKGLQRDKETGYWMLNADYIKTGGLKANYITSGTIKSDTVIQGGTLIGATIKNASTNPTFSVDSTGKLKATNAEITGTISASTITGGSIEIGNATSKNSSYVKIDQSGNALLKYTDSIGNSIQISNQGILYNAYKSTPSSYGEVHNLIRWQYDSNGGGGVGQGAKQENVLTCQLGAEMGILRPIISFGLDATRSEMNIHAGRVNMSAYGSLNISAYFGSLNINGADSVRLGVLNTTVLKMTSSTVQLFGTYNFTAIYRLNNPKNGAHIFTASNNERNTLRQAGWTDEGVGFWAFSK